MHTLFGLLRLFDLVPPQWDQVENIEPIQTVLILLQIWDQHRAEAETPKDILNSEVIALYSPELCMKHQH
eukprot:gene16797-biopygen4759